MLGPVENLRYVQNYAKIALAKRGESLLPDLTTSLETTSTTFTTVKFCRFTVNSL